MEDATARLAQSAERKALNLVVVGSSPMVGDLLLEARKQRALVIKEASACRSSMLGRGMRRGCWPEEWLLGMAARVCVFISEAGSGLDSAPRAFKRALPHGFRPGRLLIVWAPGTALPGGRHAASVSTGKGRGPPGKGLT